MVPQLDQSGDYLLIVYSCRTRATLSDLLDGNASLSPEMAPRIEKAFDFDMGV